ncbi:hypothetical protein HYPSUDRAFT_201110 [Hypholoma sublateritium FD-334 SS-4]|uniref:Uncharacterized protein n=1 Tax=Hypholoma sublateritium (strain FD-334 SS-4) TaxID=945553 RepID=A0A0D2NY54_HYPSF|nr:hypothetical protein HYPSUDRAFT_201110 [Hypholoma sublateritium FD-334 SS-4]
MLKNAIGAYRRESAEDGAARATFFTASSACTTATYSTSTGPPMPRYAESCEGVQPHERRSRRLYSAERPAAPHASMRPASHPPRASTHAPQNKRPHAVHGAPKAPAQRVRTRRRRREVRPAWIMQNRDVFQRATMARERTSVHYGGASASIAPGEARAARHATHRRVNAPVPVSCITGAGADGGRARKAYKYTTVENAAQQPLPRQESARTRRAEGLASRTAGARRHADRERRRKPAKGSGPPAQLAGRARARTQFRK